MFPLVGHEQISPAYLHVPKRIREYTMKSTWRDLFLAWQVLSGNRRNQMTTEDGQLWDNFAIIIKSFTRSRFPITCYRSVTPNLILTWIISP